jgi:phosphoribosyl 1,2-cyclic phosphate phosphodiesterase
VLGSGTSTGVPVPGCRCRVCLSADPLNKRLRTSILFELGTEKSGGTDSGPAILVDTSPDLRYQALRSGITHIDAVLYTHVHADHVFGIDDLRSFNFINGNVIPVYASETSASELESRFTYAFFADALYEGGAPPQLSLQRIRPYEPLLLFGTHILPLALKHGRMDVLGFRLGNFAYLTDCSEIPEVSREHLQNLDVLILDGLRYRPHKTHFNHAQAVREIERLSPKRSYLTHISHEVEHHEANEKLRQLTTLPVELAYDGLCIDISDNPPPAL